MCPDNLLLALLVPATWPGWSSRSPDRPLGNSVDSAPPIPSFNIEAGCGGRPTDAKNFEMQKGKKVIIILGAPMPTRGWRHIQAPSQRSRGHTRRG